MQLQFIIHSVLDMGSRLCRTVVFRALYFGKCANGSYSLRVEAVISYSRAYIQKMHCCYNIYDVCCRRAPINKLKIAQPVKAEITLLRRRARSAVAYRTATSFVSTKIVSRNSINKLIH